MILAIRIRDSKFGDTQQGILVLPDLPKELDPTTTIHAAANVFAELTYKVHIPRDIFESRFNYQAVYVTKA